MFDVTRVSFRIMHFHEQLLIHLLHRIFKRDISIARIHSRKTLKSVSFGSASEGISLAYRNTNIVYGLKNFRVTNTVGLRNVTKYILFVSVN